jgi:hypothetical protein
MPRMALGCQARHAYDEASLPESIVCKLACAANKTVKCRVCVLVISGVGIARHLPCFDHATPPGARPVASLEMTQLGY